ncbi:M23 family metallopeptidase [Pseudokineococcus basanitobsidens]|uniref:M23 family metallopeptidase n=1 Tax=Pseudokineococcus basanitobsidens TaxID=1926649 RepID=A0ABU8RFB6_9ACTN
MTTTVTTADRHRPRGVARRATRLLAVAGLVAGTALSALPAQAATGAMQVPATGRVTAAVGGHCSSPGDGHGGVDIAARTGTPVYAADDGVVSLAGTRRGSESYGIFVRVHHASGYRTIYAHLSRLAVKPNQKVTKGQVVGYVGNTGRSYGAHLHFEVRKDNVRQSGINASFRCRTNVTAGTPISWTFPGLAR